MFCVILLRVGNENFAVKISDPERCVVSRKVWIHEAVGSYLMKILIVRFELPSMEIRCIKKIVTVGDAQR